MAKHGRLYMPAYTEPPFIIRDELTMHSVLRDATIPLYERVKNWISDKIDRGEWAPGDRIPSENELVRHFGVSRMTVHRSLRELVMEQRVKRVPGVGTFVAEPRFRAPLLELKSISEEIRARGGQHRSEVLLHRSEQADAEIARALRVSLGFPLFHTIILHFDNHQPVQIEKRFVNPVVAPDYLKQEFITETPNQFLVRTVPFTEAEHVVEAAMPAPDERELLNLPAGDPVLLLRRRTWNDNELVTWVRFVHPANRFRFSGRFRPNGPSS